MTDIAFFIPSLHGGGAEKMVLALANHYASKGMSVDLVLVKREGVYLDKVNDKVRVIHLESSRVFTSILRLSKYLRRSKPRSILSALAHANIACILAKKISGMDCRVVVSQRNMSSLSSLKGLKGHVFKRLTRWAYNSSDAVVAISTGVKDDMVYNLGVSSGLITPIYNPAYSSEVVEKSKAEVVHDYFNLGAGHKVVLAVGRLTEIKDFTTLIKALPLVRKELDARLIILGEGPLRADLECLVSDLNLEPYVSLPGFYENPYAFMRKADLLVMSSISEGFGNVLVEAMSCDTPVVSTNCPTGPAEILEQGKWGDLVPVGDHEAMAIAIMNTLKRPVHPDVSERAREFSIDSIAQKYLHVLDRVGRV